MADVAELIVALNLRDGVSAGLGNLNRQLGTMQGGLRQVGRGVSQVGAGLDKALTRGAIAAGAALTGVVTTAASFEQAFTGVEKTVDGTAAQLAELEDTFRSMARTMPISFEELASIGEAGGALGIARESLDEFTDVVARLSVSTDLTADSAATALGQLGNVLHLSGSDFEDFADSLVALGNAGASTESQIVDIAARFGAAGNSAGLSKEEILALSSAVASMGIDAEAGGSSLSRVFGNITTAIGTGSDEVEAFTETMGISADEFQKRWGDDALGTFQDFLTELGKLDQFGQARVLEQAGITSVRDINAVRLMAQNVDFLGDQLTIAKDAQGALQTESDKFFNTTSGQWRILKNNVRDAAATIGTEMLPVVNDLIKEFTGWLNEPATQQGLKDFGHDLAEGVRDLVTEIKKVDWGPLIAGMEVAGGIAKAAFDAFRSLPPQVQAIAAGAFALNKATGGAVTQITKGLGNIVGGVLRLERGSSAGNPLWVQSVGGIGGGIGGAAGGRLGRVAAAGAKWVLGPLAAAALGFEIGQAINESTVAPARDFESSQVDRISATGNVNKIVRAIDTLNDGLNPDDAAQAIALALDINGVRSTLEDQRDTLRDQLLEMGLTQGRINDLVDAVSTEPLGAVPGRNGSAAGGGFGPVGPVDVSSFDTVLTREFGGKLDKIATNEVIQQLGRTTEMGLKGIGTSVEEGVKTGMDPLGNTATRILSTALHPKAPEVMNEIKGHMAGLEEIQQTYLDQGDIKLAAKVQANIDTLNELIGTTDTHRAVTERMAADATSFDAAMLSTAAVQTTKAQANIDATNSAKEVARERLTAVETRFGNVDAQLATHTGLLTQIAGKNFSPIIKNEVHNTVSSTIITNQQYLDAVASGGTDPKMR